jgi:hypothetical protein
MMVLVHKEQVLLGGVVGHRYLQALFGSVEPLLRFMARLLFFFAGLVRPRTGLENEITHKNVQKKVKCDPCAISSCEPNLVCEGVFNHERGKE